MARPSAEIIHCLIETPTQPHGGAAEALASERTHPFQKHEVFCGKSYNARLEAEFCTAPAPQNDMAIRVSEPCRQCR